MEQIFREIKTKLQFQKRSSLNFSTHVHEDIELVYIKKGVGTAFCDGKEYPLTDRSFFLVFPNQTHHYIESKGGEYFVLIVKPSSLLSYNEVFLEGAPTAALLELREQEDDNTVFLMETAYAEYRRDGYSPVIDAYITALFGKLLQFYTIEKSSLSRDTVLQILQYCACHYKEPLTVEDLARALHISRSSVSHIFSLRIGVNFCDYINALRLADAEQLLKSNNYSVTEIAGMVGFSTIRTFNRAFLKKHGISPSRYRKSLNKG